MHHVCVDDIIMMFRLDSYDNAYNDKDDTAAKLSRETLSWGARDTRLIG